MTAPTPAEVAGHIDRAADLIEQNGKTAGAWWPPSQTLYEPGSPCCTAGALTVAVLGEDVTFHHAARFTAVDGPSEVGAHPVFAALRTELGFAEAAEVFDWSDATPQDKVIARLRKAATSIRQRDPQPASTA